MPSAQPQAPVPVSDREREDLQRTWQSPSGLVGWFSAVNQAVIGRRFVYTALLMLGLGGIQGLLIRVQLAQPNNQFMDPELYNAMFTMHGVTMMFLFAVPLVEGAIALLAPMMIGTRDMAFPRLNAYGYYIYLIAGLTLYGYYFVGIAPTAGWFNYVPLANEPYSPGKGIALYTTLITFIEISALVAAVEIIVTILKLRAPGMSLDRIPIFVWAGLITAVMILFAMPGIVAASAMLALDRIVDTRFFRAEYGGDALLWQHLFWWFGHPEVYIVFLPATGIISTIIPVFARRPLFGYTAIVIALVATGILSFGLWVHHMFATGIPLLAESYFTAASVLVAIPTGVQFFCWIATLWLGRPLLRSPMLFVLGFIIIFVIGGLSGVMIASVPFDLQVHDTFFIVAHFHYVLIGGMLFPVIAGLYYWFPRFTGRMPSERLGRWSFWIMMVGFNVAFFPMHVLGLQGMPRRVYTYPEAMGWGDLNLLSTVGAFIFAAGVALTLWNAIYSRTHGDEATLNPWDADTLEWSIPHSALSSYKFAHIPVVEGVHALWDQSERDVQPVVTGLRTDRREVLVTTLMDARPQSVEVLPGPTIWPFLAAVASSVGVLGVIYSPWFFVAGFFLTFFALVVWLYPRRPWRTD